MSPGPHEVADVRPARLRRTVEAEASAGPGPSPVATDARAPAVDRLVYPLCSPEPDENEDQVEAFPGRHPDFDRDPAPSVEGPSPGAPGERGNLQVLFRRRNFDRARLPWQPGRTA